MKSYYYETPASCGDFMAESDEKAKEIAKGIKNLFVLYTEDQDKDENDPNKFAIIFEKDIDKLREACQSFVDCCNRSFRDAGKDTYWFDFVYLQCVKAIETNNVFNLYDAAKEVVRQCKIQDATEGTWMAESYLKCANAV